MNSTYTGKIQSGLHADLSVSRPLNLLFTNQDGIATDSVISTNSTAKLWNPGSLSSQTAFTPSSTDQSGPFNVMAVATKSATVNNKAVNSNVLVLGSNDFANGTIQSTPLTTISRLSNSTIILNTFNKLVGYNPGITVSAKNLTTTALSITSGQAVAIIVIFVFIVPIVTLIAGLVMWLRRRHQ